MLQQLIIRILRRNTKRVTISAPHFKMDNVISDSDITYVAGQINNELEQKIKSKLFDCWKANNTSGNSLGQKELFEDWYKKNKEL
jgi:hypothetical protein